MLYCPKCQHTYETGSQRFCKNDGARLLLATAPGKAGKASGGVFSNLLGRGATPSAEKDEKSNSIPRFTSFETAPPPVPEFIEPKISEPTPIVKLPAELKKEEEIKPQKAPPIAKPLARIVKPSEIHSGTASVGDRKSNPTGRLALTWEQPKILLGQTVKGRYSIVDLLGEDEASISYLAEDKIVPGKKAFVRVFMDEDADDNLSNRIFAEERVSLSHINHPNIASVIDSGDLPEGKPFIVSEYLEGKTVRNMLDRTGQFNVLRTARIIRQASYALSEAHQNGVLHRNLKPENIFLTVTETGTELVKLTNFGVLYDKFTEDNLAYKSPEQLAGKLSNYASDIFSLAVIAYQMLTGRLPFSATSVNHLLRAQREGLTLLPTNLRLDVEPQVDDILEKALSFHPSDRYPKARDFGDALFHALTTVAPWEKPLEDAPAAEKVEVAPNESETADDVYDLTEFVLPSESGQPENKTIAEVEPAPEPAAEISPAKYVEPEETKARPAETVKTNEELPWEKRSPEPVKAGSPNWLLFSIFMLGLIVFLAVWYYFLNRQTAPEFAQTVTPATNQNPNVSANQSPAPAPNLIQSPAQDINEVPPIPRKVPAPPNWAYFENSKQNLQGELAKNFLGFSLYYPKDWVKSDDKNNFLDVSKNSPDGQTMKKAVITRYNSLGTFNADKKVIDALKQKSDKDLGSILTLYKVFSDSETTIQNGRWKAFEVKFQGGIIRNDNGDEMQVWGRRFWIPVQRPGMKSGFVITLLATSLADDVTSVDQVAFNDDLAQILETFEPAAN